MAQVKEALGETDEPTSGKTPKSKRKKKGLQRNKPEREFDLPKSPYASPMVGLAEEEEEEDTFPRMLRRPEPSICPEDDFHPARPNRIQSRGPQHQQQLENFMMDPVHSRPTQDMSHPSSPKRPPVSRDLSPRHENMRPVRPVHMPSDIVGETSVSSAGSSELRESSGSSGFEFIMPPVTDSNEEEYPPELQYYDEEEKNEIQAPTERFRADPWSNNDANFSPYLSKNPRLDRRNHLSGRTFPEPAEEINFRPRESRHMNGHGGSMRKIPLPSGAPIDNAYPPELPFPQIDGAAAVGSSGWSSSEKPPPRPSKGAAESVPPPPRLLARGSSGENAAQPGAFRVGGVDGSGHSDGDEQYIDNVPTLEATVVDEAAAQERYESDLEEMRKQLEAHTGRLKDLEGALSKKTKWNKAKTVLNAKRHLMGGRKSKPLDSSPAIDVFSTQAAELKYGFNVQNLGDEAMLQQSSGRTMEFDCENHSEPVVLSMSIWTGMKFQTVSSIEMQIAESVLTMVKNEGKALIRSSNEIVKAECCVIDGKSKVDTIVCTCGHQCLNHANVSDLDHCPVCSSPITAFVQSDGLIIE